MKYWAQDTPSFLFWTTIVSEFNKALFDYHDDQKVKLGSLML